MANALTQNPIIIDTDITDFRAAVKALSSQNYGATNGPTITKLVLAVGPGGAGTAGTVTITDPQSSITLYPGIVVTGTPAANTFVLNDNVNHEGLTWKNFAVTGVTATGTRLFLWSNY